MAAVNLLFFFTFIFIVNTNTDVLIYPTPAPFSTSEWQLTSLGRGQNTDRQNCITKCHRGASQNSMSKRNQAVGVHLA